MRIAARAWAASVLVTFGLFSCDRPPTGPSLSGLTLDIVSGDGQTAVVGTQLAPLIVKVTSGGNPVASQVLNFVVTTGGGSVFGGTELTDAHGIAQELWTLGTNASDAQRVEVRAVESSTGAENVFATFTATALPGPAAMMKVAVGGEQTAGVGQAVATPPAALVIDQYANPVAGVTVTFAVSSGGGIVAGANPASGANGVAAVSSWTLGPSAGTNALTATSAGLSGSPLTFVAIATGPGGLNITNHAGDGQTQAPGGQVLVPPTAQVTDQTGRPVSGVTVTFSVSAGGGSITGPVQVTDVNGMATVGSWTLGPGPGTNELKAAFNTGVSRGSTIFVATGFPGTWQLSFSATGLNCTPLPFDGVVSLVVAQRAVFAGTCAGLFRSTDNGGTWATSRFGTGFRISALGVSPLTNTVFAGSSYGSINNANGFPVTTFRSPDLGATWSTPAGLGNPVVFALAGTPQGTVLEGSTGQLSISRDDGATWGNVACCAPAAFAVASSGDVYAADNNSAGVFHSSDQGSTWNLVGLAGVGLHSIAVTPAGHLFAGTYSSGILRSTDGGATWVQLDGVTGGVTAIVVSSGQVVAGVAGQGVFTSSDDGGTWTPANIGLTDLRIQALVLSPAGLMFAGTPSGVFFRSAP